MTEYNDKPAIELDDAARAYFFRWVWARDKKAEMEAIEKEARVQLEEALGENEVALIDGKPVITWAWSVPKDGRFDQKAFEADNPELFDKYKVKKSGRSFRAVREP